MKNPFLKKKVKKESVVEKYLVQQVQKFGGEIRKVKFLDRNGAPDRLIMFRCGVSCWVELKSEVGKARPEQLREHDRLRVMGQRVQIIWNETQVDVLLTHLFSLVKLGDDLAL